MKHPPEFLAVVDAARTRITELAPEEAAVLIEGGAVVILSGTTSVMRISSVPRLTL